MTKVCRKCSMELTLDKFLDKVGGKFNKDSVCKPCKKDLSTEHKRTKRGLLLKYIQDKKGVLLKEK